MSDSNPHEVPLTGCFWGCIYLHYWFLAIIGPIIVILGSIDLFVPTVGTKMIGDYEVHGTLETLIWIALGAFGGTIGWLYVLRWWRMLKRPPAEGEFQDPWMRSLLALAGLVVFMILTPGLGYYLEHRSTPPGMSDTYGDGRWPAFTFKPESKSIVTHSPSSSRR